MKKMRIILVILILFPISRMSIFSLEKYDTDLCITRYNIRVKPDFLENTVDITAVMNIRNLSAQTHDKAEMLCGRSGNHDDWNVEVQEIWHIKKKQRAKATLAVRTIKNPYEEKDEWPLYEVSFLNPLEPNDEATLEFRYRLKGKKPDDGFPLHRDGVTELYLISDFFWLPMIYVSLQPGRFPNIYKPTWNMRLEYPSGFASVTDGKRIRKEEKNGRVIEDWQFLGRDIPQLFISRYGAWKEQADRFSIEINYPIEKSLSEPMRKALSQGARIFGLYSDLFGALESPTFRIILSLTDWGGHGLTLGTVMSSRYLEIPSPALIQNTLFHEMAHSWWGLSVSSFGEGSKFLREGLAEFSSLWALRHLKGSRYFDSLIRHQKMNTFNYYLPMEGVDKQFPLIEQEGFDPRQIVGANYRKGPLIVNQLRLELGDKVFWGALGTFARRFRGKTADIHDFIKVFNEISGQDLTPLFKDLCWSTGYASYKILEVRSSDVKGKFETRLKVRNEGDIGITCPLLLKTKSGEKREVIKVPGKSEQEFIYSTPAEVIKAVVDPEQTAFQYDPEEKYRAYLDMDEAYLDDRTGENWFVFNVSYAQYIAGQYEKAAATLSRQIQMEMDKLHVKSGAELLKAIPKVERGSHWVCPLYAAYIFVRAKYYIALGDERRAEEDIKAALPVMAAFIYEHDSSSRMFYTATGILSPAHTPKDMDLLIQGLCGRPVGFEDGLSPDELKQKFLAWETWWEKEGQAKKLNSDLLRRGNS